MPISDAQSLAIEVRLYEILDDGYGVVRTVPPDRVAEALLGQGTQDAAMDALVKPRIEIVDAGWNPSPSRPMSVDGPNDCEEYAFTVRATYALPSQELGPRYPDRLAIKAQARRDCSLFKAALEYPPNMLTTSAGDATGVIAGMLEAVGSTPREREENDTHLLVYEHRYRVTVQTEEPVE